MSIDTKTKTSSIPSRPTTLHSDQYSLGKWQTLFYTPSTNQMHSEKASKTLAILLIISLMVGANIGLHHSFNPVILITLDANTPSSSAFYYRNGDKLRQSKSDLNLILPNNKVSKLQFPFQYTDLNLLRFDPISETKETEFIFSLHDVRMQLFRFSKAIPISKVSTNLPKKNPASNAPMLSFTIEPYVSDPTLKFSLPGNWDSQIRKDRIFSMTIQILITLLSISGAIIAIQLPKHQKLTKQSSK